MKFSFHKYQGTGNDFVMIDDRARSFPAHDRSFIERCCDRRFGIGADGLILLQESSTADFKMVYFNADGRESTLCGNGARCTVAFAASIGIITTRARFEAIDGEHTAVLEADGSVALRMHNVEEINCNEGYTFLDTGSPHHVEMVEQLAQFPVNEKGRLIRQGAPYFEAGTNVNFVEKISDTYFAVRTYERGVEDETLSCGTGATAVAIAMHKRGLTTANQMTIEVQGGSLEVSFSTDDTKYTSIDLKGPAKFVFAGEFE